MAIKFFEVETRKNGKCTVYNCDGYTDRKTVLGAVHDIGKEIAKIDEGEGQLLINVRTGAEAKQCIVQNTSADSYCFELEDVPCASQWNEEEDEMEYSEGTYYFHIRFFVWDKEEKEEKEEKEGKEEMMTMKKFEKKYGVHFTVNHTGKMEGMASLSTSVIENPICAARAKVPGSICEKCFAAAMMKRYGDDFRDCFRKNTEVLTGTEIPVNEWPVINYRVFRLESFGDLANVTQVRNYFNFARRNPGTTFALWTKNPAFIDQAINEGSKKPKNLIIIQSSCFIDREDEKAFDFIDKVFTVYSKPFIAANGTEINCGARNCLTCGRCYSKRTGTEVREQLK